MSTGAAMQADPLTRGRLAHSARIWDACWSAMSAADRAGPLEPEDLLRLAESAYLVGQDGESIDAFGRAYAGFVAVAEPRRAARSAFQLAFLLSNAGEPARSNGWLARARSLVDRHALEGAEAGLLDAHGAHLSLQRGDATAALELAERAAEVGRVYGDADLLGLALLTAGHARVSLGHVAAAGRSLDEVMLAVTDDEVSPIVAGVVYCAVIAACRRLHDTHRAREWTAALSDWCDTQPGLVPYRGICMVHRAELMTEAGRWDDAAVEAALAAGVPGTPIAAEATYLIGELHRLRGEAAAAEDAYRQANTWGRRPEPGLMRLRLAQGRLEGAGSTARVLLAEGDAGPDRPEILAACVDVAVAAGDLDLADDAAAELDALAAAFDQPVPHALAARCHGRILLAQGRPGDALPVLREGVQRWSELTAPYPGAVMRDLLGECYRALGDEESALLEFDAARWWYEQLGARPDAERLATAERPECGLTPRELQVLRLLATGTTNRSVANELYLSEKTVARHLSNIYGKLGVTSRSAATAYAYDHHLL